MGNKEKYYQVLKNNNNQLNEVDLGEQIGLDEDDTRRIISQLLFENRIEYEENNVCNYKLVRRKFTIKINENCVPTTNQKFI